MKKNELNRKNPRIRSASSATYEAASEGKYFFDDELHQLIYPFPSNICERVTGYTGVAFAKIPNRRIPN